MRKPSHIAITIPNPCTQNWDSMTPTSNGRHCDSCQKTVIDFTEWTDTALYNFFASNKGHVCGRYLATQVDRPIHIPYQPQSRIYRVVVAMGLTLVFTQVPAYAQSKPPIASSVVMQSMSDTVRNNSTLGQGHMSGVVIDDSTQEPFPNALVMVYIKGVLKGGAVADFDGKFVIDSLDAGNYDVKVSHIGYDWITKNNVIVEASKTTLLNFALHVYSGISFQVEGISVQQSRHHKKKIKKHHNKD